MFIIVPMAALQALARALGYRDKLYPYGYRTVQITHTLRTTQNILEEPAVSRHLHALALASRTVHDIEIYSHVPTACACC